MTKGRLLHSITFALLAALAACAPKGEALYARAEESLAKGELRAAVLDLRSLVRSEPQNAKARALLGRVLFESGDYRGATVEIQKAKDLGAPSESTHATECLVMASTGEFDRVLADCSSDSADPASKPDLQIAEGRALLGMDLANEARAKFEAALQARPDSLDAMLGVANAVYAIEGLTAAKAVIEKAAEDMKARVRYWQAAGGLSMAAGDFAAAELEFKAAVERSEKNTDEAGRIESLGGLAEAQIRQGKVDEATATTDRMVKSAPNSLSVKQLTARVAAAGGDLEKARMLLEEVIAKQPENLSARLLLGVVNSRQGNLGQAEMHFAHVVGKVPSNVQAQRLLAETRAQLRTPGESLSGVKAALESTDSDPSLLAMAGRLSLASGDRTQALAYLAKAAGSSDAQTPEVQLEIANSYLLAGDLDRALEVLDAMPASGATAWQRDYLRLMALVRKGESDKAIKEVEALVARSGEESRVRNLAAAVYASVGRRDAAREHLNTALKTNPEDTESMLSLARLDLADGKSAEAEVSFKKVLAVEPKNLVATLGLAATADSRKDAAEAERQLKKATADHPGSIDAYSALVNFYLGGRQFDKAKAALDVADKAVPNNAALANMRGFTLLTAGDVPAALGSFKRATELEPTASGYTLNLARAHILNRDLSSALELLNSLLQREPGYVPALGLAAMATLQSGQIEKATGYIARLREGAPELPLTLRLEGDLAMAQKRHGDAVEYYRKARARSDDRDLMLGEYRAMRAAGMARPQQVLEAWLAKNPRDAQVTAVLAEEKMSRGDTAGAIALYERALGYSEDNGLLLNNLAMIYLSQGNPKAIEVARKAYEASPEVPAVQDTYGWVLVENGQLDKGIPLLREAAKGLAKNAEVQYHLGSALARKGERDEALQLLRRALSGGLPPELKTRAQQQIEQLKK